MRETTGDQTTARRELASLRGIVYRAETGRLTGRNSQATQSAVLATLRGALAALVALEDADGVEATAALSDKFTDLRQRATAAGLITASQVAEIEREVCA